MLYVQNHVNSGLLIDDIILYFIVVDDMTIVGNAVGNSKPFGQSIYLLQPLDFAG